MTGFSDLSNELVLEILRHVAPSDLDSACTFTKSISLLAAPILEEHRRLKQHYLTCCSFRGFLPCTSLGVYDGANDKYYEPLKVLIKVLTKPRIAHYVRRLNVFSEEPGLMANERTQAFWSNPDRVQLARAAIESTETYEFDTWLQAFQNNGYPYTALLLFLLPNLSTLELKLSPGSIGFLSRTTQKIQHAPAGTYLAHLKRLSVNCSSFHYDEFDLERSDVMRLLMSLLELPTLASCYMNGLELRDEDREMEPTIRPRRLGISDLSFVNCHIGEKMMFELLRKTAKLKTFGYLYYVSEFDPDSPGPDWYWLAISLAYHAGLSLEKLQLQSSGKDARSEICGLRDLTVLREIDTDLPVFLDSDEIDVRTFREMLPASIKKIHIRTTRRRCNPERTIPELERIRDVVQSMVEEQYMLLPQLTEICVISMHDAHSIFADTEEACALRGIFFSLQHWYDWLVCSCSAYPPSD